jgi:hypothetical protein
MDETLFGVWNGRTKAMLPSFAKASRGEIGLGWNLIVLHHNASATKILVHGNSSGPEVDSITLQLHPSVSTKRMLSSTRYINRGRWPDLPSLFCCRSRGSISMEIIASAIFGRSSFPFGLVPTSNAVHFPALPDAKIVQPSASEKL